MIKKILPFFIFISALAVSFSSAYYSIWGLTKLFAGAQTEVMIMAAALELSKLVVASLLYEYWNKIGLLLKTYLTSAVLILILISSIGIYGFLSSAYQQTANSERILTRQIELIENRQSIFVTSRDDLISERENIINSISDLRNSLGGNVIQYVDRESGELITTTSSANRRAFENQLDDAIGRRDNISLNIQNYNDSIGYYDIKKIELQNESESTSELATLYYISKIVGIDMDYIVNYFMLLIIFVFDPLAVALVISTAFSIKMLTKKIVESKETEILYKDETEQSNDEPIDPKTIERLETIRKKKVRR